MIRLLAFLLCFPVMAFAQDLPRPLSDTVSDFADLLDEAEEARLSTLLKDARKETGVHIVLVTMGKREAFGGSGRTIISYAKALFNDWGVGDKTRNDGILILVERDNREMRIALGAGYDAVYDGLAQRVIDREMLPNFRNGDYAAGIEAGAQAVLDRLARPFSRNQTPIVEPGADGLLPLSLFGIGALGVLLFAFRRFIGDALVRMRTCPNCGKHGLSRRRVVDTAASETLTGHGTETTRCRYCNHEDRRSYTIPVRSTSSSSSGFGGGRSSGGGASGKW